MLPNYIILVYLFIKPVDFFAYKIKYCRAGGGGGEVKSPHEIEPVRGSISIPCGYLAMAGKGKDPR